MFLYFLNRSNLIMDIEILFVLERFFYFYVKELCPAAYKNICHDWLTATPIEFTQFSKPYFLP
jgi:hypothetical protein